MWLVLPAGLSFEMSCGGLLPSEPPERGQRRSRPTAAFSLQTNAFCVDRQLKK